MMDTFRKVLIFGIFCVFFQKSCGRKWYTYEPYWGSSHNTDESKFIEEGILNMYPENNDESLENKNSLKINTDVSKEFRLNSPQNENPPSNLNSADFETLETQVGEHLVKVTTKKESKSLSNAPRGGGYDISINPKYSHIVEIIHRRDKENQNKPSITYGTTVRKPSVELKTPDYEKVIETLFNENRVKFGGTDKNSEQFEAEEDHEESDETEGESEKFIDANDTEENVESERENGEVKESREKVSQECDETENTQKFCEFNAGDLEKYGETEETKEFGDFEEDPDEYGETEETKEFSDFEEDPDEYGETEETKEFSDFEEDSDEYNETEETKEFDFEDSDEYNETEETKEFGDFEDPDKYNETEETKEFGVFNEEDHEEYGETEDSKKFGEFDENLEEYSETEETKEFGEFDEYGETEDSKEFNESEEDSENFNEIETDEEEDSNEYGEAQVGAEELEANERDSEEFKEIEEDYNKSEVYEDDSELVEINQKNAEETDKADERGPEVFEVGENVLESIKSDERDKDEILSGLIEYVKKTEEANKKNAMGNEQISNDKESFNEEFEGSGEEFVGANDRDTTKEGRILMMLSRRNETIPTCTTQRGEAGHCRRLGECLLSEALSNFNGFLQQLCLIRGVLVGICCPDNPVIETMNPEDNSTNELSPEDIEQPAEGCGLNTKTRIVGGSISVPHEWTWMVALMRRNRFYCGGVIINNWYILTAAHCVMGMNVKDLTVRLGEYDFNEQNKHTEDLSVSEIKRHAQFITLTFQHDIALLKLKRSIKYSKFVGSICLPEQKARDYSDVEGTVVGWGTVSFGGAASPVLRQVTIPVWKNEDCDRTYMLESIGNSFMCAGSPEKGEDACQGDSGGPLMTVNENGRWEVIGLVSWGRRCGDPTYPGVYTRVTTYLDWIKQNAV